MLFILYFYKEQKVLLDAFLPPFESLQESRMMFWGDRMLTS